MRKNLPITERDIYVTSERAYSNKEAGEYLYNICYCGNIEMSAIPADDVREIIACLQHALDVNEKGGSHE
ncbi:hypothetical protein [uncultured Bacteroides sp.]|uniref:hypothetical protein n=1 Tax=uncultured Bacteroides sp. TaxID=162156 RepID=UPI002598737D|nr:hypothetical protein [uncultured Bacteroides sp.]